MKRALAFSVLFTLIAILISYDTMTVGRFLLRRGTAQMTPPVDPGLRTGAAGAGGFFSTISSDELTNATSAALQFNNQWSVTGGITGEPLAGFGPDYNANACGWCHAYPALGGSSPSSTVGVPNAEIGMATLNGANTNTVPTTSYLPDGFAFIRSDGPTRIPYQPSTNASLRLYTIVGMIDAPGSCTSSQIQQPNFAALLTSGDITAHIPIPLFGAGLLESTPNSALKSAINPTRNLSFGVGVTGTGAARWNFEDANGTISRFGWKAASPSVYYFAALALSLEMDVTSDIFKQKLAEVAGCIPEHLPEDTQLLTARSSGSGGCSGCSMDFQSQAQADSFFARYLDAPVPACTPVSGSGTTCYTTSTATVTEGSVYNGLQKFAQVGCDTCHIPSHTTGLTTITGQSGVTYSSYSDYALHNMGIGLADGLSQGSAGPQDFKSSALWGTGKRIFFLHDGRTQDVYQAIEQHCSSGSEATTVCADFNALLTTEQQDLINFLRSL